MAKSKVDIHSLASEMIADAKSGKFASIYLLMGEEPYYIDKVSEAIAENCVEEFAKSFNEIICYGSDVSADYVVSAARQYPMMGDRQLLMVREAQKMRDLEALEVYCRNPLESTVLVLCCKGKGPDKRKSLYKTILKNGLVLDSQPLRDYEVPSWISAYYSSRGLQITPDGAALFAEYTGTDLSKIVVETDKLLKNLPESAVKVTAEDIEKNVGISRQYSIFELNNLLSKKDAVKALKMASSIGAAHGFAMPMAVAAMYSHFIKVLRYGAALASDRNLSSEMKAKCLPGVSPFFYKDYDVAVRNYPPVKCMKIISLLREYDYLAKGGDGQVQNIEEIFVELVAKILS